MPVTCSTVPEQSTSTELPSVALGVDDPPYEPPEDMNIDEPSTSSAAKGAPIRGHYSARFSTPNLAMVCDRFGASDRLVSAIVNAAYKDANVVDLHGNPVILDKSKVAREKLKSRNEHLRKQHDASNLKAFSFDGRKDDSLTREKIDGTFHTSMVKEPHLVITREPRTTLMGYVSLDAEDAESKYKKLIEFFDEKKIS